MVAFGDAGGVRSARRVDAQRSCVPYGVRSWSRFPRVAGCQCVPPGAISWVDHRSSISTGTDTPQMLASIPFRVGLLDLRQCFWPFEVFVTLAKGQAGINARHPASRQA